MSATYLRHPGAPVDVLLALSELSVFPPDGDVAKFLGVSTRTLRRYRSAGLLKSIRLGDGHPRLSRGELARFIIAGAS
jgi:hypothetical protein